MPDLQLQGTWSHSWAWAPCLLCVNVAPSLLQASNVHETTGASDGSTGEITGPKWQVLSPRQCPHPLG